MLLTDSTEARPAQDQSSGWLEELSDSFMPMQLTPADGRPTSGRISTARLGLAQVGSMVSTPVNWLRTRRHISRDEQPCVLVVLQVQGCSCAEQDGRKASLAPGDMVLFDTTRPLRSTPMNSDGSLQEQRVLLLPKALLGMGDAQLRRATVVAIRGDSGLEAMFISFLFRLAEEATACSPSAGARLAGHAADLLVTLLRERGGGGPDRLTPAQQALLKQVETYINERLPDPALSPETIARSHHISVRYLHKLFQLRRITVGRYIRQRRLEECHRELRRGMGGFSVSAVAQRWGFASPAHFSRLFRDAYGVAPSDWQRLTP
ncbi:AraC-like ligand-binding domain-containing protein [Streptomyces sp. NPDC003832]